MDEAFFNTPLFKLPEDEESDEDSHESFGMKDQGELLPGYIPPFDNLRKYKFDEQKDINKYTPAQITRIKTMLKHYFPPGKP
jgi:hypothetical protein